MAKAEPLPVAGYQPQSAENIDLVNRFKAMEENILREIDEMRACFPDPRYDQRWLSIAQTNIEQGFMALNRAVFRPTRVRLPGDETAE